MNMHQTQLPRTAPAEKPKRIMIFGRCPQGEERIIMYYIGPMPEDLTDGNAVTIPEVMNWFREAEPNWNVPDVNLRLLHSFIDHLNATRLSEPFQPDRNDPALQRPRQIAQAIHSLRKNLPASIESERQLSELIRETAEKSLTECPADACQRLLNSAEDVAGCFPSAMPRKRHESWHDSAIMIASFLRGLWRSVGRNRIGCRREIGGNRGGVISEWTNDS